MSLATELAQQTVRAIRGMDGSTFVCLLSPDDSTEGEDKSFDLIYRMLGFCQVQKDGSETLRFLLEVNEPERVAEELRKIVTRVAEKARSKVGTSGACETIANRIAESVVREVGSQTGKAIGLFSENRIQQTLKGGPKTEVLELEMTGSAWFYSQQTDDPLRFLLESNNPDASLKGLREIIAEAVKAGIEQSRS